MTPFRIGTIAALAAVAMIVVELAGHDWFVVRLGGFAFPLWILVAIYAALQFLIWQQTKRRMILTDAEVARWGDKLELATPKIVTLTEQQRPVREIAAAVKKSHGIPPDVTLRYIVALAVHTRRVSSPPDESGPQGAP